ncbi:MAG: TonB-dependent receptor, partial [Gemmatimonadota bacterium]|nr:TonB-dependent receptor [Gemmatimonadota bacterium]
ATQTAFGLSAAQRDNIAAGLRGLTPTNTQVNGVLRNLGAPGTPVVPWTSPVDLSPLTANFSNTYELGYKGVLANKFRLAVDLWYQIRPADPTTQVINLKDAVFLDPTTLGSYLGATMGPVLAANGVPGAAIGTVITGWVTQLAQLPGGMLNFNNPLYDKTYLVFTYQNATGQVDVRGVDVAMDYLMTNTWNLEFAYSNLSKNVFIKAPGASAANPLAANTPKHRGSIAAHYSNESRGVSSEFRVRYTDAFNVNSGVYNNYRQGTPIPYSRVRTSTLVDAGFSWRLPFAYNVRWAVNAQNIFDYKAATFIGVPAVGRFVSTRLQYTF